MEAFNLLRALSLDPTSVTVWGSCGSGLLVPRFLAGSVVKVLACLCVDLVLGAGACAPCLCLGVGAGCCLPVLGACGAVLSDV